MRLAPRGNVDLAVPRLEHRDGQRSGCPEAEQSYVLSRLHSGNAQAAKSDDARAEQWRGMQVVKAGWQRKDKIGPRHGKLGIAAIHRVAREYR